MQTLVSISNASFSKEQNDIHICTEQFNIKGDKLNVSTLCKRLEMLNEKLGDPFQLLQEYFNLQGDLTIRKMGIWDHLLGDNSNQKEQKEYVEKGVFVNKI